MNYSSSGGGAARRRAGRSGAARPSAVTGPLVIGEQQWSRRPRLTGLPSIRRCSGRGRGGDLLFLAEREQPPPCPVCEAGRWSCLFASQGPRRNRRRRATRSRQQDCPGRECVPPRRDHSGTVPTGRGSGDDSREGTAGTRGVGAASKKSGMALPATLSLTRAHHRDCGGRAAVARLPPS